MIPKASIIIPVFSADKCLHECLDSVVAQSFTDWECILVDDGSKDSSPAICDEYAANDKRFKVIHTANGGQGRARNIGLDVANGEFIMFVDSDDKLLDDNSLENCILILDRDKDIDFVQFAIVSFHDDQHISEYKMKPPQLLNSRADIFEHFEFNNKNDRSIHPGPCAKLYRKHLFTSIRFPEGRVFEDAWMLADMFELTNKVLITNCGLYGYRHHESSTTHSMITPNRAMQRLEMYLHVLPLQLKYSNDEMWHNQVFWCVIFKVIVGKMLFGPKFAKDLVNQIRPYMPKYFLKRQRFIVTISKLIGFNAVLNLQAWYLKKRLPLNKYISEL